MNQPIVLIGCGEVGGVFARGSLRSGYPVYPVLRATPVKDVEKNVPDPEAVIVATGEKSLPDVLDNVPKSWRDRLILVQNELLPKDWEPYKIQPTVVSVWFEKKWPNDYKVIIPSPVYGRKSDIVEEVLNPLGITVKRLKTADELLFELVLKNLYILTVNIAGIKVGGTVSELWRDHNMLAKAVANDVLNIQFKMIGKTLDREKLIAGMVEAFEGDPQHKCMGRSAPARLERALAQADEFGVTADALTEVNGHSLPKS